MSIESLIFTVLECYSKGLSDDLFEKGYLKWIEHDPFNNDVRFHKDRDTFIQLNYDNNTFQYNKKNADGIAIAEEYNHNFETESFSRTFIEYLHEIKA